jgi:hypothetical protein
MKDLNIKIANLGSVVKNRWNSETPKIFKKVRNTATILAFLMPIAGSYDDAPDWFKTNKWYIMSASGVIAGCSQLTKKVDSDGDTIFIPPTKTEN